MADRLEMARYYHRYQEAAVKCSRAKQDLDKIEKQLQNMPDPDTLNDLLAKKEAAQARYDELKEALADAESLAMTGQPRQTMKARAGSAMVYFLGAQNQQVSHYKNAW